MQDTRRIVIIGAGIVGASIAHHLVLQGAQVRIVDGGRPGQGATAVSFAWMNAREKNPRHYHDLNRRSLDMWDRFSRQLGGEVGLTWGGELRWASTAAGAERFTKRVRRLQSWGYPIHSLSENDLRQLEPGLSPGSVSAASISPADGHVDTALVVEACLKGAVERGAILSTGRPVSALIREGEDHSPITGVRVGEEEIPCDVVVLAAGPDGPELAALAGIDLPVRHTFGATILTEATGPLFQRLAVIHTPADLPTAVAIRQLPDGAVMIHGGDGGADESLGRSEAEIRHVFATAAAFVPALEGLKIREVRRGRRPIPLDGHPIMGFSQAVPNLYLATMHSGVTLAPLAGAFATLEILEGARIKLLEPYRLERFSS